MNKIKQLRNISGCGFWECKQALEVFPHDLYLAAGWLYAKSLAINIRGHRHQWNIDKAPEFAERFRNEHNK